MTPTVKHIGDIGVDAGLCWIGDPSYILHAKPKAKAIGKDWHDFCALLHRSRHAAATPLPYDDGRPGLGVVVTPGPGDGHYPVYAEFTADGRIAKVWVEFLRDAP
jgi:hypothetical protein